MSVLGRARAARGNLGVRSRVERTTGNQRALLLSVHPRPRRQFTPTPSFGRLIMSIVFTKPMVNLYTRDIEAGLHFDRDLLGFRETFPVRTPDPDVLSRPRSRRFELVTGRGAVVTPDHIHLGRDVESCVCVEDRCTSCCRLDAGRLLSEGCSPRKSRTVGKTRSLRRKALM